MRSEDSEFILFLFIFGVYTGELWLVVKINIGEPGFRDFAINSFPHHVSITKEIIFLFITLIYFFLRLSLHIVSFLL